MTDTAAPSRRRPSPRRQLDTGTAKPPPLRRSYAKLASDESREDYSLRYAPHSFRRWSPAMVAGTALGGIACLADFAIGLNRLRLRFHQRLRLGLTAATIVFLVGTSIARACAKYGVELVTCGSNAPICMR